jgi:hypothetical protein
MNRPELWFAALGVTNEMDDEAGRWLFDTLDEALGWPHRFLARMRSVGTDVFVAGSNARTAVGVDDPDDFTRVAAGNYSGGIWTDRIEIVGPAREDAAPPLLAATQPGTTGAGAYSARACFWVFLGMA